MVASRVIECVFEDGVFKPLQKVDFKEGEKLRFKVEKFDISKYYGAFGEGTLDEFKEYEEEARM